MDRRNLLKAPNMLFDARCRVVEDPDRAERAAFA